MRHVRTRVTDTLGVAGLASAITAVLAWWTLQQPASRLVGLEVVGRHHDPFTAMLVFQHPAIAGVRLQPLTDLPGAMLAAWFGPVAAYNALVLLSFPLAAVAAFQLARFLRIGRWASGGAALAFAFSPFHLAQAAYHPHVAQVYWLPVYLWALWAALERASPWRLAGLVVAIVGVVGSNYYGGLVAATLTPVALLVDFAWRRDERASPGHDIRRTLLTLGGVVGVLVVGLWLVWPSWQAAVLSGAFPVESLSMYGARWWSYLLPPVAHPWLGEWARSFWVDAQLMPGLVDQQLSLGLGAVLLAGTTLWRADRDQALPPARRGALWLLVVWTFLCSLAPLEAIPHWAWPATWVHAVAPMFRSFARFGVVVQLLIVVLAAAGAERLWHSGRGGARALVVVLAAFTLTEYLVTPASYWRDVLPTPVHRWVADHSSMRAMDCAELNAETVSVEWLTEGRIRLSRADTDCQEPDLVPRLVADGFTHLIVQRDARVDTASLGGLSAVAELQGHRVFALPDRVADVFVAATEGLHPRERDRDWTWRWIDAAAIWRVVTAWGAPAQTLWIEVQSVDGPRTLDVMVGDRRVGTVPVTPARAWHRVEGVRLPVGSSSLRLVPVEPAAPPTSQDGRALSVAIGGWRWEPSAAGAPGVR